MRQAFIKRTSLIQLCIIIVAITGIHSFKIMKSGFINGKIYPAALNNTIVAIDGKDSVSAISENGSFGLMVKPGLWKIMVFSKGLPLGVVRKEVRVLEGKDVSLGEIRLTE